MNKIDRLIEQLCPNGVEHKTIQELCSITRGRVMSKDYIRENIGEYPVYSSQTENNGELGKISIYDFDGEYLTWTTDGANAGSVFYRNGKFSVTNVCGLLKVIDERITTKFLYYALSIEAPKYVNAGMGNPKLMSNVMAKIKVAVPPLEVQCEIVHILDDFTLLSAELSAELKARQEQYEYYRDNLLDNKECVKYTIQQLIDLGMIEEPYDGNHGELHPKSSDFVNEGIPFIMANDLKNNTVDYENCAYITEKQANTLRKGFAKPGDVLLTHKGTIGRTAIVPNNFDVTILTPQVTYYRVIKGINNQYLKYYFDSTYFQNIIKRISALGGTRAYIGITAQHQLPVLLPPIELQNSIVKILEKFDKLSTDISEGLPAEIKARRKQYEYYRDKLLTFKELVNEG